VRPPNKFSSIKITTAQINGFSPGIPSCPSFHPLVLKRRF
jgi:hypothetical protein